MTEQVLLVLAGGLAPLIMFLIQQRTERLRHSRQTIEARLNELIDRLEQEKQNVRSGAVVGIVDLMIESDKELKRGANPIFVRGLGQIGVLLHTEEDGAVQETLVRSVKRLAAEIPMRRIQVAEEVLQSCLCARRWMMGSLSRLQACVGAERFEANRQILADHWALLYGLKRETLECLIRETSARQLIAYHNFRFDSDKHKRESTAPVEHFGNVTYRYQCCLRSLRLVAGTLRNDELPSGAAELLEGALLGDERAYVGGIIALPSDASEPLAIANDEKTTT